MAARALPLLALVLPALLASLGSLAQEAPLVLEGDIPDDAGDFYALSFEVPVGTAELQVTRVIVDDSDVIDFGVWSPSGFRGWSGGNTEPAIIGAAASSRSYLPGPLEPGTWEVVLGRARVRAPPAEYRVEVVLRDAPTLLPDETRRPWDAPVVEPGRRWYAGDFHVHSRESGDAVATLDEIAALAREQGLDFVVVTDHNTTSHHDQLADATARHPGFLFVPGIEFTTYRGHATVVGARRYEDHRVGLGGLTVNDALRAFEEAGALVSVNHPVLDLGDVCIGCAWTHDDTDLSRLGGVEIATGGWEQAGWLFTLDAMAFWDSKCDQGAHLAALGGSDDHRAGRDLGAFQSPIGAPTTLVLADALSEAALLDAIRSGRTVVKLSGADDPMIELEAEPAPYGDTVYGEQVVFTATVTGGEGKELVLLEDGFPLEGARFAITSDPFTATLEVEIESGRRYRAEVWSEERPHTVTSHLWVERRVAPLPAPSCGCRAAGASSAVEGAWLALAVAGLLHWRARRRR